MSPIPVQRLLEADLYDEATFARRIDVIAMALQMGGQLRLAHPLEHVEEGAGIGLALAGPVPAHVEIDQGPQQEAQRLAEAGDPAQRERQVVAIGKALVRITALRADAHNLNVAGLQLLVAIPERTGRPSSRWAAPIGWR